jgi:hypothetical protein
MAYLSEYVEKWSINRKFELLIKMNNSCNSEGLNDANNLFLEEDTQKGETFQNDSVHWFEEMCSKIQKTFMKKDVLEPL